MVVVPYNASAFKLAISGVSIIFPQALAINNINGNLVIGDGGDGSSGGQIVQVTPAGVASVLSLHPPIQPVSALMPPAISTFLTAH